ncbi:MAG TPA: DUF4381 family protein [Chthoniobacterales bacterium]|nr:DUF4381 family protein [Chthoniobacterales bacterium]
MPLFLAQELHDISPPVDYSLIPLWAIFGAAFLLLAVVGFVIWGVVRWSRRPKTLPSARSRALELLRRARGEIAQLSPYEFSIRVSDILRRYVTEQYRLPVTRQTSVEFLETLAQTSPFSDDEKSLLGDFLNRCDLIKFARYDATIAESELLLEEATRFVQGGQLEPA